jgi:hypothetical protein
MPSAIGDFSAPGQSPNTRRMQLRICTVPIMFPRSGFWGGQHFTHPGEEASVRHSL